MMFLEAISDYMFCAATATISFGLKNKNKLQLSFIEAAILAQAGKLANHNQTERNGFTTTDLNFISICI